MSGTSRTSRSSTERVASANDWYEAVEAAAAALIAPESIAILIIGHLRPGLKCRTASRASEDARAMRLATFLPPGAGEPLAGEVRDAEVVAFGSGTVRDRLASGDRTPGRRRRRIRSTR